MIIYNHDFSLFSNVSNLVVHVVSLSQKNKAHSSTIHIWRWAFHLDIWSTHDQPASCRVRPLTIEDGLEDTMWIRSLGGERLLASMLWSTKCSEPYGATSIKTLCRAPIWPVVELIYVQTLILISNWDYIRGQSGTWYNSREQSIRHQNIRRRLSLCCCSVPVYLVSCRTSRYALRLETTHYVYDYTAVVWDLRYTACGYVRIGIPNENHWYRTDQRHY